MKEKILHEQYFYENPTKFLQSKVPFAGQKHEGI
jgi:hypothetical protein